MSLPAMGDRTPHDALRDLWGERDSIRRSQLTPERTRFLQALLAVERDAADLDKRHPPEAPRCALPQLRTYAAALANAWTAENGWDTQQLIDALQATSAQTSVHNHPEAKPDA